jgi:hypothetical protein
VSAYILVKALVYHDGTNLHTTPRGCPVEILPNPWGQKCVPPRWIWVHITDREPSEIMNYKEAWQTVVNFTIQQHNVPQDGYRIKAEVDPLLVSASGLNSLTRDRIESYLNRWGATVKNVATNSVVFDAGIYNALKSEGFWGRPTGAFTFMETYNSGTGVHTIAVYYGATPFSASQISGFIVNKLGLSAITNIDEANKQITFVADSSAVYDAFKADVKQRTDRQFAKCKWLIMDAAINAALANGGMIEATAAQALNYLHNRLED